MDRGPLHYWLTGLPRLALEEVALRALEIARDSRSDTDAEIIEVARWWLENSRGNMT